MLNLLMAAFDNLTPMNWAVLKPALNFLWQGLLAIFVVIGLIIISVKVTAYASRVPSNSSAYPKIISAIKSISLLP